MGYWSGNSTPKKRKTRSKPRVRTVYVRAPKARKRAPKVTRGAGLKRIVKSFKGAKRSYKGAKKKYGEYEAARYGRKD